MSSTALIGPSTGVFDAGELTREEIVEFAEQFGPLPYHSDEEAAIEAGHEGLIASGYHTFAVTNGLIEQAPDE